MEKQDCLARREMLACQATQDRRETGDSMGYLAKMEEMDFLARTVPRVMPESA